MAYLAPSEFVTLMVDTGESKIRMSMRDTLEPGVKDDLIRIAGKGQVPCLIVDGVPMFESDDIIRFLGDLISEREEG